MRFQHIIVQWGYCTKILLYYYNIIINYFDH